MRRIGLYLGVPPRAGGMFQYAQSLLQALASLGGSTDLVFAYTSPEWAELLRPYPGRHLPLRGAHAGQLMANGLMAARVPGGLSRALSRLNPIVRQLRAARCDAWLFPAQEPLGYQLNGPTIVSIHDLMHRYEPHFDEVVGGGRQKIRDHRFANLARHARAILVDSEVGRGHVVESYGADPAQIFPLPYVPGPAVVDAPEPADFDALYPLPARFLFYPAQFWSHKNHRRLFAAMAAARATCPDIRLVCTGMHAHDHAALVAHAAELGLDERILFPGYVPDAYLGGFYRRARALVMPTFFGPTNIPPLEAFACGCPVAISGTYGMPEQAGDAALFFDPLSVTSIEQTIERLWRDDALCADLRAKGLARSAAWRQPHFAARLSAILDQAIAPSR